MTRLLIFTLLPVASRAAEIVVAGDSWGAEGKTAFEEMFSHRSVNVTISNVARSGSRADQWAKWGLKQHLSEDTRYVWLSISGNDAQKVLPGCGLRCVDKLVNETKQNLRTFVQPALDAFPKVRFVMFGCAQQR